MVHGQDINTAHNQGDVGGCVEQKRTPSKKESDHDEPAHDVRAAVDEAEVHDVLAHADARARQRALPAAGMVWQRAHGVVPRVAFLDPRVRGRVLVRRHRRERDGGGLGVLRGGDVELGERLGDPLGRRGGAATAFGGLGCGLGGRVGGRGRVCRAVTGALVARARRGGRDGRAVRGAEGGVGGGRGGHLGTVGGVDGLEDAALDVAVEVGGDTKATAARLAHKRWRGCQMGRAGVGPHAPFSPVWTRRCCAGVSQVQVITRGTTDLSEGGGSVERLFAHPAGVLLLARTGAAFLLGCARGTGGVCACAADGLGDVRTRRGRGRGGHGGVVVGGVRVVVEGHEGVRPVSRVEVEARILREWVTRRLHGQNDGLEVRPAAGLYTPSSSCPASTIMKRADMIMGIPSLADPASCPGLAHRFPLPRGRRGFDPATLRRHVDRRSEHQNQPKRSLHEPAPRLFGRVSFQGSCTTHTNNTPQDMPVTSAQKAAIEDILDVLVATTPPRGKRHLAAMFMDLVDRADWPEYYEVRAAIHIHPTAT